MMAFARIYTGPNGDSRFGELDLPFEPTDPAKPGIFVPKVTGISFRRSLPETSLGWHPAEQPTYVVTLTGESEIEVGNGEVRRFGPGDVVLGEDLTGRGHNGRNVGSEPRIILYITLER